MDIQKQIEEALEKITQGAWSREGEEIWRRGMGYNDPDAPNVWICDVKNHNNAHLIANAPEWLRHQQSIISQQQAELKECEEKYEKLKTLWLNT